MVGYEAFLETMKQPTVPVKYFSKPLSKTDKGNLSYGWISTDIAYLHISHFENVESTVGALDEIMQQFKNSKGLVIDIRRNRGGVDQLSQAMANRFTDTKRLYLTSQNKIAGAENSFTAKKYMHIQPDGPFQYTNPIILLTDRLTVSSGENFALAMNVLPHVTVVGDFTSGCFSDMSWHNAPNGWRFSLSYKLFLDHKGICWEGIGVPPDIRQVNSAADIRQQKDRIFELACTLLKQGKLKKQNEILSIQNVRESLIDSLKQDVETYGFKKAMKLAAQKRKSSKFYINFDEFNQLGINYRFTGRWSEAIKLYQLAIDTFPKMSQPYYGLGNIYFLKGKKKQTQSNYKHAVRLNKNKSQSEQRSRLDMKLKTAYLENGFTKFSAILKEASIKDLALLTENYVNNLGYDFVGMKKFNEAIFILKMNIELHPKYANGYDSLGEIQLMIGDKSDAVLNYKKSVELNPKNSHAIEILQKIAPRN